MRNLAEEKRKVGGVPVVKKRVLYASWWVLGGEVVR